MKKRFALTALVLFLASLLVPAAHATAPALPEGFKWIVEPGKYKEIYQYSDGLMET